MKYQNPSAHISGWLHPLCAGGIQATLEIQEDQNVRGHSLEIGVYLGKTLGHLIKFRRSDEITIGIDPFLFTCGDGTVEDIYEQAVENIHSLNQFNPIFGETLLLRGLSSDKKIISKLRKYNKQVRVASVDGSHTHDDVFHDLCLVDELLNKEGVIILDDFCNPVNPEVTSALKDFLCDTKQGKKWLPVVGIVPACSPKRGAARLFLQRNNSAINYQNEILKKIENTDIPDAEKYYLAEVDMFDSVVNLIMLS